jgi:hypothetical protein
MQRGSKLDRLERRVDAAMRRVGMDPTKPRKKHGFLFNLYTTPGGVLIAWLLPGVPPPGPFG